MTSSIQLVLTAMASLAVGAAGTYATTVHVSATCAVPIQSDDGLKAFLAPAPYPATGNPRY